MESAVIEILSELRVHARARARDAVIRGKKLIGPRESENVMDR